jgi:ferredoxin
MSTGPSAERGFDLALIQLAQRGPTEALAPGDVTPPREAARFLIRVGSREGAEVLESIPDRQEVVSRDLEERETLITAAIEHMGRSLDTEGLPGLLARNINHPRWETVAERCLSCGNCTMVCPSCFCSDVNDVTNLSGGVERERTWASCFDLEHSYLHGGAVRSSPASRYRQWATHKLSTWHDQFGTSGCVGCGRCITWCPVGIDLTEEVAEIRASDGSSQDGTVKEARP